MMQATARSAEQDGAGPGQRPLSGRHALITGGNRGIGAAIAERLAALGAGVTLVARDAATLDVKATEIREEHGVSAVFATADVTDEGSADAAFEVANDAIGPVDILVNNAGSGKSAPFKRTDLTFWRHMIDINLTSAFLFTSRALPSMVEAGYGRIVNVASTAGLVGYRYVVAYCAAKHGVVGLTRALALETAKTGVTVNAVCPGYVDTDMTRQTIANIVQKTGATEDEAIAQLTATSPQGRLIQPGEVASAVAWLALPEQAAMTGQSLPVASGEVM